MQILTQSDAALYQEAFAAQEKKDWAMADRALAAVEDRELVGHVLADRYQRRSAAPNELHNWLVAYADLPEAAAIYKQTRDMRGSQNAGFAPLAVSSAPNISDAWRVGHSRDYLISYGFKSDNDPPMSRTALKLAARLNRAIRRDHADQAEKMLKTAVPTTLAAGERAALQAQLAAGYFYNRQFDAARRVASLAAQANHPLGLWIDGLGAWRQKDGLTAGRSFARLAMEPGLSSWDHAAAAYWAYRANKLTGNAAQANYWLRQAATQPHSFYGLMAAQLLAHDIVWSWEVPKLTDKSLNRIADQPAGHRALALLQIDQTALAEAELRHLNPRGQHDVMETMLALAEKKHMAGLAVQLGGLTNDKGRLFDAAFYPVPSWRPDHGFQVDRALMYALIRHESGFNPQAISGAGACGLMQLMPSTASLIAKDDKATRTCAGALLRPGYNMGLGQKYLQLLASQPAIGDNLIYLLTAYNSGPGKVLQWTGKGASNDPLFFIETMPVRETRLYVQQVMIHYWSYRARLNQPETSLAQLARGEWPRYALHDERPFKLQRDAASDQLQLASD